MADSPNAFQGGSSQASVSQQNSTAGSRSPIITRSRTRRLSQQQSSGVSSSSQSIEEEQPPKVPGSLKRRLPDNGSQPLPKKARTKATAKPKINLDPPETSSQVAPEVPETRKRNRTASTERASTSNARSSSRGKKGAPQPLAQREPRPSRFKAKTTGSCASSRRRSSRVNKLAAAASGGSLGGGGSPMSNVDTGAAQEGTSASFTSENDSNANPSNTASGGAVTQSMASKTETEADENEMGRLQALLEARGLPPHLFGALGPRMQNLLHRSLGSSGSSSACSRAQQLLTGLQQAGDEGQQLQAVMEMCQLLVMGNEDTLAGFPVKQAVPVLITLLKMDHNFDMMNHACRALTYMMEALPRSSTVVVDAVPIFLEKLQVIQCMDVAEQALTALEMLSRRHSKSILHAKGVSACLMYLDFFSINAQRAALAITANCCQNLTSDEFALVSDSISLLSTRLTHQDKKSVESVCLAFSRLIEGFHNDPKVLLEISSQAMLSNIQQLLAVSPPLISSGTFVMVVRMLAILCGSCPELAVILLKLNIAETLCYLLLGPTANKEEVELVARTPQELFEITSLIGELMPRLPSDGIFSIDSLLHKPSQSPTDSVVWQWKDDRGNWHPYASIDNKMIEAGHHSSEDEISLSTMGRTYTLDFNSMQQINEDTGTTRAIQRKVNNHATSANSFPNAQLTDSRADCLQENTELAFSCIKNLFGVLYEVYSSSAGPAVRHRCLRALLRMVYFSPVELLKEILKNQPVSSHLAAMLSSQDLRVVVSALQMAEILMQKLPDIFEVYFRREGVMHQIKWLARMDITPSNPPQTATNSGEPGASGNNYPSLPTLLGDKSPSFLLNNSLWPASQPQAQNEEESYLSLNQVKLSDVLKRKRTPKRSNTATRKARTEDSSSSRDSFNFGSTFPRNIMDNPMIGSSMITLGTSASPNNSTASPILCPSTSNSRSSNSGRLATKTTSLLANLNPTRWAKWSSNSRSPPTQDQSLMHKNQQYVNSGHKDKIRTWIKERAIKFEDGYFNTDPQSHPALNVLNTLVSALEHLEAMTDGGLKSLLDIRKVVIDSDISSFELNHSGLVNKLLTFLTSTDVEPYKGVTREDRLRLFLHVFIGTPKDNNLNFVWEKFLFSEKFAMGQLVTKLNACVGQLEQFSVKVHDLAGSSVGRGGGAGVTMGGGTSALKFFNTHQLKCNLQRHPSCNNLRQWRDGPVKIDPLALVQAIERYLVLRGYGRIRDSSMADDDQGNSDDDNSEDDMDDTMVAMMIQQGQGKHRLQFLIGDNPLPYNMTVYQAIRQFSESGANVDGQETDTETETPLGYTNIWIQTHTIWYKPVSVEESGQSSSGTSKSSNRSVNNPSTSGGSSSRRGRVSPKKKSDDLWVEGIIPPIVSPLTQYLVSTLPASVTVRDPSLEVITLMRVLYGLCNYWYTLYTSSILCPKIVSIVPQSEFVNAKLTAKANRQLQDPLAIMTGNIPSWLSQVAYVCPFVFPFETRHLLFYVTSFDRDRALQRLLDMSPELTGTDSSERVTPRLDRRKKTVSRTDLLKQAETVIQDMSNSKALLEIQYENEVGTGLGPTLEFYALVSKELQRVDLEIWRGEPVAVNESKDKTVEYIHSAMGLFPLPIGRTAKANHVSKVRQRFKLLGKFMAKALMDSRMLDISLSEAFYRWLLSQESNLYARDMENIDPVFAKTFRQLELVTFEKHKLQKDPSLSPSSLKRALEKLTLDGHPIDDLNLDFTLPGPGQIDLRKGGKDILVTVDNVNDYVKLVTHWTLVEGVRRQMDSFKEGFESIFPLNHLSMFYPQELENLFCGSNNSQWDLKMLNDCCKPDHGYSHDSRAIKFLFSLLSNQTADEQRYFLQFVTGSPRLPVGGLKSLTPPLTIVRKTLEASEDPDEFLPSVMTCVNYLKLPDYSSIEKMREKLKIAVSEGQHSFFLS